MALSSWHPDAEAPVELVAGGEAPFYSLEAAGPDGPQPQLKY